MENKRLFDFRLELGMKVKEKNPPREFEVGRQNQIKIKDCGYIMLEPDEQVTFITADGKEYDVARKNWGYCATPSVNSRLKHQGFKTALVKNTYRQYFVMIVEEKQVEKFLNYLDSEKHEIVDWLDER